MAICLQVALYSQGAKATLTGTVKDTSGAVLQGAVIVLEPAAQPITTNGQGEFALPDLAPGKYKVKISSVGFQNYTTEVTLAAGQEFVVDAVLKVASENDEVIVTAERPHGEAEVINRTVAAENLVNILPADVITSLPNANIADALGRMPGVTIERDEGEGKYVQIRGTEPRLTNTMVDGISVPSPESGVRQIKLDTIASDLVDSVEINKTLQANIDADGIGGSVNLVTKTATDEPLVAAYGIGGYTPIIGGRDVYQYGSTFGKRFGGAKKLGLLFGGTYDYNGRGINDIEPDPQPNPNNTKTPYYDTMDVRDYVYYRTRWGLTGTADYRLGSGSSISVRGLFSTFRNWGNKWVFSPVDGDVPSYSQDWRRPDYAVGSLSLQGRHLMNANTFLWTAAVGRARELNGSGSAKFSWVGDPNIGNLCHSVPGVSVYRPGWSSGCFGTGADNEVDSNNYKLKSYAPATFGQTVQLNLEASGSYARLYHIGSRYGTFEFGGKIRNQHKFADTYEESYSPNVTMDVSAYYSQWGSNFTDPNYYDKTYHIGPVTAYDKIQNYVNANPSLFSVSGGPGPNSSQFDLIERIPAGYVMNTIDVAPRVRLNFGVRIEATHVDTLSFDDSTNLVSAKLGGDYIDVDPSASIRFATGKDSDLRFVYGRGLARPDPQDIAQEVSIPTQNGGKTYITLGNPNLKPEHANNYDVLFEKTFNPLGLITLGWFYKDLTDPIATSQTPTVMTSGPYAGDYVTQPINFGSGYVQGVEIAYLQHLTFLPGVMHGAGISANYSYTTSAAHGLAGRSDTPALQRQAPNAWNISPTYDTRRFSLRMGMEYDGTMIYAYQWQDGADPVGGVTGPLGDNYLYAHFQVDAQASYRLPWGFSVYGYGLNLNNEVFGFYNGSTQYVVQREYYHPTYAGGLRWNLTKER
jgi:TonB-dependent receptor